VETLVAHEKSPAEGGMMDRATRAEGLASLRINRSQNRRRISPWLWLALAAVVAGAMLAPGMIRGLKVVEVSVAPALRISSSGASVAEGSPELTAAGYVVADRQSVLATKFTGRLYRLYVAEADFVKKGDLVAEIDHTELDAAIAQAEAEMAEAAAEAVHLTRLAEQAEAELAAAGAPLKTLDAENKQYEVLLADAHRRQQLSERLGVRNAIAASEIDDRRTESLAMEAKMLWTLERRREAEQQVTVAKARAAVARAAVPPAEARQRSAAARVEVLKSQLAEAFIRSPFDGMVTEKAAEVGEIVAPISIGGSMARGSIVTIADWASLQAEVDVAEAQLARVQPGQRAAIAVDAIPKKIFPGKIRRILPHADRSKATVKVRVDFLARDERAVLPEMGVRVQFLPGQAQPDDAVIREPDKIVVPKAAIRSESGGSYVWLVSENEARKRPVEVGAESGDQIEITNGLSSGEKVVIRGAEWLTGETARVRVTE
jgi:RND family efflux transporter MFP subunit